MLKKSVCFLLIFSFFSFVASVCFCSSAAAYPGTAAISESHDCCPQSTDSSCNHCQIQNIDHFANLIQSNSVLNNPSLKVHPEHSKISKLDLSGVLDPIIKIHPGCEDNSACSPPLFLLHSVFII